MSKHKKAAGPKPNVERQSGYYDLKTQAINDLAEADESNSPEVSQEELRQYTSSSGIKIPYAVKMLFIKFWFAGATCFFFIWGLGGYLADQLDLLFVTGLALGMVTDILTNNALRFLAQTPGGNDRWMMFPKKGFVSLPLNVLYAFLLLGLVYGLYSGINWLAAQASGMPDSIALGVEPILFGLFYLGFDELLLAVKRGVLGLVHGRKKAAP